MRKSFVNVPSPALAGVIRERTVRDCIAEIRNCEYHGADVIDLHLSCMNPECRSVEALQSIVDACSKPILALHYRQNYDHEIEEIDEEERVAALLTAVDAGVAAIDMQGYTFDLESKSHFRKEFAECGYSFVKNDPKEIVVDPCIIEKQMALIEEVHARGAEVLLSTHPGVVMNTEQVVDLALFLEKRKPDIIKIITGCNNEDELAESFKTMVTLKKEVKTPVHFHCGGKAGKLSRIVNPMLGAHLCFCIDRYSASSNFEQLDLQTARSVVDGLKKLM